MSHMLTAIWQRLELSEVRQALLSDWGIDERRVVLERQDSYRYVFLIKQPLLDVQTTISKHTGWRFGSVVPDGSQWNLRSGVNGQIFMLKHKHVRDIVLRDLGKSTRLFITF